MEAVHPFITRLLKLAGDWLRCNAGEPPYYLWVLEAPPHRGLHLHYAVHVPLDLRRAFVELQRSRWVYAAGALRKRRVLRSKSIRYSNTPAPCREYVDLGIGGLLAYLLKGTDPSACTDFRIRHQYQGVIIGKRCGTSQALGPKARHLWEIA